MNKEQKKDIQRIEHAFKELRENPKVIKKIKELLVKEKQ